MAGTTKLDAVNIMLSAIGEAPVNSLSSGLIEAEVAETILNTVDREVQSMGWHFNIELNKSFPQDTNGEIILPANILRADATSKANAPDLVQRGLKMYDRKNHTFNIGVDVALDVTLQLSFEDVPEVAKRFMVLRSTRIFQDRVVGDSALHQFHKEDENRALVELKDFDKAADDHNIFDNYDTFSIIDRQGRRTI
jgi:hypothetical protein|tara:strand:- start:943 stop:1527 length:585 start_codon:yes stop_codon:yes gene_type:complete